VEVMASCLINGVNNLPYRIHKNASMMHGKLDKNFDMPNLAEVLTPIDPSVIVQKREFELALLTLLL